MSFFIAFDLSLPCCLDEKVHRRISLSSEISLGGHQLDWLIGAGKTICKGRVGWQEIAILGGQIELRLVDVRVEEWLELIEEDCHQISHSSLDGKLVFDGTHLSLA